MTNFEVIIIGGSYSGLSAAMALGRSLRSVLIIDSGKPCNLQTPHSHNFLTQDGKTPTEIAELAKAQVMHYDTIRFHEGLATAGKKIQNGFQITLSTGENFTAKKLIFATGVKDEMLPISGFSECWGISVIHCPYCHGYEVKSAKTGILGNGEYAYEFSKMIANLTDDLTIYTNGPSILTNEQISKLTEHKINIVEKDIDCFNHTNGQVKSIFFKDGTQENITAIYARAPFKQQTDIPETLGCILNEDGYIETDHFQQTTIPGIYACGDNTTFMRSVANAVAMGNKAGAIINRELINEAF